MLNRTRCSPRLVDRAAQLVAAIQVHPPPADPEVAVDELLVALGEAPVAVRPQRLSGRDHVPREQAGHDAPEVLPLRVLELGIFEAEVGHRFLGLRSRSPSGNV